MMRDEATPAVLRGDLLQRVAVFRALQLGDMLVAVPALRALRAWAPHAHITLVGLPWAADFVARYPQLLDDFLAFPGATGFPEQAPAPRAQLEAFYRTSAARRFDLAIQMHGTGRHSNSIVVRLGAGTVAGFVDRSDNVPQGFLLWPAHGSELERCVSLVSHLGAPAQGLDLEFSVDEAEQRQARSLLAGTASYVILHAGARMASRRWPVERFAACGRALAADGHALVLTGSASEASLVARLAARLGGPARNLAGRTSLGVLAGVVGGAALLVTNDTGISHIAAALGTPSVVITLGSDPERWAPLDHARHEAVLVPISCRPCMHVDCPIGHPCAQRLEAGAVLARARALLERVPATH